MSSNSTIAFSVELCSNMFSTEGRDAMFCICCRNYVGDCELKLYRVELNTGFAFPQIERCNICLSLNSVWWQSYSDSLLLKYPIQFRRV